MIKIQIIVEKDLIKLEFRFDEQTRLIKFGEKIFAGHTKGDSLKNKFGKKMGNRNESVANISMKKCHQSSFHSKPSSL